MPEIMKGMMKMINFKYDLHDIVEMKKLHPCASRCKYFQIVRMGADIKIRCLGCGNYIMFPREEFEKKVRRKIDSYESKFLEK